jgi:hypothetical protein
MSRPAAPRVRVTIDRLVLRGFAPEQRNMLVGALEAALRAELATAASAGARPFAARALASLRLSPLRFAGAAAPSAARIGGAAGRALGRGVRS